MIIEKDIKKKITKDWQDAFPQLSLYAPDKLYKIVGPVLVGLELTKLPRTEEYRLHFVVYPLWRKDVKTSLSAPIILKEYCNKKGLQYSIPYANHCIFFNDILESIRKQTPMPFDSNISRRTLTSVIDGYSQVPPLSAAPNSYLQALLQEAKLKVALFINKADAQSIFELIVKRNWDTKHFEACGTEVGAWTQGLRETIDNRDDFLKQIELNKQAQKLNRLQRSGLTN